MNRTDFLNEILPTSFSISDITVESGPDTLRVYNKKENIKLKDVKFMAGGRTKKTALSTED